ncbi:MAG: ABC transporter permease subunit [Akkermansiaceae bacterium]|nr:ABC transporter permease subunit [Akkermansiaceae bacterium]
MTREEEIPQPAPPGEPAAGAESAPPSAAPVPAWRRYVTRWATIRDRPSPVEKLFAGMACLLLVMLVWAVLTAGEAEKRIVGPYTLPSIGETLSSFESLWFERALARSALWSLGRVLGGFLLAAVVAVPLGVVASCYPRVNAFLRPLGIFGRNVPIAALIPLTLMWFGLGETQKVMFIFLASAAFIFFDTTHAVDGVSNRFLDTAYTLGARTTPREGLRRSLLIGVVYAVVLALGVALFRRLETPGLAASRIVGSPGFWLTGLGGLLCGFAVWFPIQAHQAIRKVILPLALPDIVNSLRLLFGLAFGYIMLAEVINAKLGLGSIIIMSQRRGPREHIYLILIIISLLAFAIDRLVFQGQKRWFPYREHAES